MKADEKYHPFMTTHKSIWARAGVWFLNGLFFAMAFAVVFAFVLHFCDR